MAKTITRQLLKLFGRDGDASNYGEFGSERAGTPVNTKDIPTIQSLPAWLTGLQDAINASKKAPYLEDINSVFYAFCYQIAYILQDGIPEWDPNTSYYLGSYVRLAGTAALFGSRIDDNLNNALPAIGSSNSFWDCIIPTNFNSIFGSLAIGQIPDNLITSAKILSLDPAKLSSLILASQIQSLNVSQLLGVLGVAQGGTGRTTKVMNTVTYLGNSTPGHQVAHGLGTIPDLAVVVIQAGLANVPPVLWSPTLQGGSSRWFNGTVSSNDIVSGDATNITLGTSPNVNTNAVGYTLFTFKGQQ